jgi:hypothetical protein
VCIQHAVAQGTPVQRECQMTSALECSTASAAAAAATAATTVAATAAAADTAVLCC